MVDNPAVPPRPGGGGLNAKLWGLPTWGWIAIAAAGGIGLFVWLQSRKKNSTSDTSNPSNDQQGGSGQYDSDEVQSLLAQIRDYQGQLSTPDPATPAAPSAVTNLRAAGVYKNHINLVWDAVPKARGYDITWTDGKGAMDTKTSLVPAYTLFNLPPGMKYTIKVRARTDGADTSGAWSSAITVTTLKK